MGRKRELMYDNKKGIIVIIILIILIAISLSITIIKDNKVKKANEERVELDKIEQEENKNKPYATITVKQDGSGDFKTVNEAIESITDARKDKKYLVEIYEGEYDICKQFTEEEINSATYYPTLGFVGLEITNGIYLKGVGDRDKIILKGELSMEYSRERREAISTLNLLGNCGLENLTVTSKYIRYPVHDDFQDNVNSEHTIINCNFINYANSDNNGQNAAYGLGTNSGATVNFENCNFEGNLVYHNNIGFKKASVVNLKNSNINGKISLWHFDSSVNNLLNIDNSQYDEISHTYNEIDKDTIEVKIINE